MVVLVRLEKRSAGLEVYMKNRLIYKKLIMTKPNNARTVRPTGVVLLTRRVERQIQRPPKDL